MVETSHAGVYFGGRRLPKRTLLAFLSVRFERQSWSIPYDTGRPSRNTPANGSGLDGPMNGDVAKPKDIDTVPKAVLGHFFGC
jgi:hypothetical protein